MQKLLQNLLNRLNNSANEIELKNSNGKMELMKNLQCRYFDILLENQKVEFLESYIYLG